MHPDHDTLVSITNDLAHVHGGQSVPAPSNPLNLTPNMLRQGVINTADGNVPTFQRVNCVDVSKALPDAPAALQGSFVCTATGEPLTAQRPN